MLFSSPWHPTHALSNSQTYQGQVAHGGDVTLVVLPQVNALMDLAADKLDELAAKKGFLERNRIRVQIIGDLSLLPPRVQRAAAKAMLVSKHFDRAILNICLSYTSRQEILCACSEVRSVPLLQLHAQAPPGPTQAKEIHPSKSPDAQALAIQYTVGKGGESAAQTTASSHI